ncbi:hypothetical protein [Aquitalea magnusonii]
MTVDEDICLIGSANLDRGHHPAATGTQ